MKNVVAIKGSTCQSAFPQLKEISFKMTITLGGGVSIYHTVFSKVLCLSFCQILSPYQDSHMQTICGNPDINRTLNGDTQT